PTPAPETCALPVCGMLGSSCSLAVSEECPSVPFSGYPAPAPETCALPVCGLSAAACSLVVWRSTDVVSDAVAAVATQAGLQQLRRLADLRTVFLRWQMSQSDLLLTLTCEAVAEGGRFFPSLPVIDWAFLDSIARVDLEVLRVLKVLKVLKVSFMSFDPRAFGSRRVAGTVLSGPQVVAAIVAIAAAIVGSVLWRKFHR
ncbi:unnamed protein product, partial [Scytosiphon promiscuus]